MRSATFRLFFAFLVMFMLLSTLLGYQGIARLRREGRPPFSQGLYTAVYALPPPSEDVIRFLDSTPGRILAWSWALAISVLSGLLVFRQERVILGGSILFLSCLVFGWIGLHLFLHAMLN